MATMNSHPPLSLSERKYQAVWEYGADAMVFLDQDGVLDCNASGLRLFGLPDRETMLGRPLADFAPPTQPHGEASCTYLATHVAATLDGEQTHFECQLQRSDGALFVADVRLHRIDIGGGAAAHGVLRDITRRKAAEDEIRNLAFYDPLTRLPNRRLLQDRLRQALAGGARSGRGGALLFLDLDKFKTLNDTLGHDIGDLLLQQVAQRLATCVRAGDTVARLGGDEFVVMLADLSAQPEEAAAQTETVAAKILASLGQTYLLAGHRHHSTPSIGAALFDAGGDDGDDLLKRADLAMYQAKQAGRNTLRFFDPAMQDVAAARAALEAELRQGFIAQEFLLHYQPQVDAHGRVAGAEALLRWQHPRRGLVPAADFIALAEGSGLILELGAWVLDAACRQLAVWAQQPALAGLHLAVNIGARQLHHPDFVEHVLAALAASGADPHRLRLELTENQLPHDAHGIIAKMQTLQARGVGFALDDFGSGHSSLACLKRLPLAQLKIDGAFVRAMPSDTDAAAIAAMIVGLGRSMKLDVVAEGVETAQQRELLLQQGCCAFQGHWFAPPLAPAAFAQFAAAAPGQGAAPVSGDPLECRA